MTGKLSVSFIALVYHLIYTFYYPLRSSETVLKLLGAQESIPRNRFRQPMQPGRPVHQPYSYSVLRPHRRRGITPPPHVYRKKMTKDDEKPRNNSGTYHDINATVDDGSVDVHPRDILALGHCIAGSGGNAYLLYVLSFLKKLRSTSGTILYMNNRRHERV